MSYSIKLKLTKTEKSENCMSHLFGSPVIPLSLQDTVNDLDADIMFFGQLDLSKLEGIDSNNKLPHKGYLYLFLDTAYYPYEAKVLYSEEEPICVIDEFNSEVEEFKSFTVPYAIDFEKCENDCEGTKLFGSPSCEWDCEDELLMQFDPLDNDTGFLSSIDGYAFFVFTDRERTFENIRFVIDRS